MNSWLDHPVTLFLDSGVTGDPQPLIDHCNAVLAINTDRRLVIDRIEPMNGRGWDGTVAWKDELTFPIHLMIHKSMTGSSRQCKAAAVTDSSGAGVIEHLFFPHLYGPDEITSDPIAREDLYRQVEKIVHEIGHLFGAAIGEYYSTARMDPLRSFHDDGSWNRNDPYWFDHPDFEADPMMRYVGFARAAYGRLTAAVINNDCRLLSRPPAECPRDMFQIIIRDGMTGKTLGARVRSWDGTHPIWTRIHVAYTGYHGTELTITKWDLQEQAMLWDREMAEFYVDLVPDRIKKPFILTVEKIDEKTVNWVLVNPSPAALLSRSLGRDWEIEQIYPYPGIQRFTIDQACLATESEWMPIPC